MLIQSDFVPAWWLPGGHLQTLWPFLMRRALLPALRSERLELADGDFVDLAWTPSQPAGSKPLVCLFHGLEGSLDSHYARGLLSSLHAAGYEAVLMHFRGCSGSLNRLPRRYHSGDTGDIAALIAELQRRFPQRALAAIGISLGGNALLKYLGEQGEQAGLQQAIAVSVPLLLAASATRLNQGCSRLYQWHLLRSLKAGLQQKQAILQAAGFDIGPGLASRDFWQFDDRVTAPLHGFADVHDYYQRASSRQYLRQISIPTLIIQALDDPFLTPQVLPTAEELAPNVTLELSQSGGHVGFVTSAGFGVADYWLDRRILRCLA